MYSLNGMKNIVLRAKESLVKAARRRERKTAGAETTLRELHSVISTGGRKFTRDEMNER